MSDLGFPDTVNLPRRRVDIEIGAGESWLDEDDAHVEVPGPVVERFRQSFNRMLAAGVEPHEWRGPEAEDGTDIDDQFISRASHGGQDCADHAKRTEHVRAKDLGGFGDGGVLDRSDKRYAGIVV